MHSMIPFFRAYSRFRTMHLVKSFFMLPPVARPEEIRVEGATRAG
jgi:hypothetical protein